MKNLKLKLLYILTFGIFYLVAKKKALKHVKNVNTQIQVSTTIPFEVQNLLNAIGGIENYVQNSTTINSLKIFVKDIHKIDVEAIKKMGAHGTILGEDNITCLFGNYSKTLSTKLNEIKKP